MGIEVQHRLLMRTPMLWKRLQDIVLASLVAIAALPTMLIG